MVEHAHFPETPEKVEPRLGHASFAAWIAFAIAVVAQLGPLVIMVVVGWTDDSPLAVVPLFTLAAGLSIGVGLLVSPRTRPWGKGILSGTALSLLVFGSYLFALAMALSDV